MTSKPPPRIFSSSRRIAARQRMLALQTRPGAARYVLSDMVDDMIERLQFLRHQPRRALVVGDWTGELAGWLQDQDCAVCEGEPACGFDEEVPIVDGGYDLIASLATLDTVNDLPGALIHLRAALSPGGLMLASLVGAGTLPALRAAMLAADGDRPAPRMHPAIDVRSGGQLLQRAGFADPVIDSRSLAARYRSLDSLVLDLRSQGLGNVLARPGPALNKAALAKARAAFGKATLDQFEIVTLSGWHK